MDEQSTIDPSFVIKLIRQMLPCQGSDEPMLSDEDAEKEDPREAAGCILWDLASSENHAELMADNYILDVLLAFLQEETSSERLREICLGILGNMACYRRPATAIVEKAELLETAVAQLCLTDTPVLLETCRLLNAGLHSEESQRWAQVLNSDEVLERLMWIAQNTLNDQLAEKSTQLLLSMVDSQKPASAFLLPSLVRVGLVRLTTNLVESELDSVLNSSKGDAILDVALQIAQEVTLSEAFGGFLANDDHFCLLVFKVIEESGKDWISAAAISAMVLLANLIADNSRLLDDICRRPSLVENLFNLLPAVTNDTDARVALWSIIRSLVSKYAAMLHDLEPAVVTALARGSMFVPADLEEDQVDGETPRLAAKFQVVRSLIDIFKNQPALPNEGTGVILQAMQTLEQSLSS